MKLLIWLLIILAGVLVAIGIPRNNEIAYAAAIIVLAAALIIGLGPRGVLRREAIIEQWANLIEAGDGHGEEILANAETFLQESEAPAIHWERKRISPGLSRLTDQREFLVITDKERRRLRPYQIYAHTRDYGKNLSVSWFLTFKPTIRQALLGLIPFVRLAPRDPRDLDLFEVMDLGDYATNAHRCLLRAVEGLMEELGQDVGKIDRKSKGVLEVW